MRDLAQRLAEPPTLVGAGLAELVRRRLVARVGQRMATNPEGGHYWASVWALAEGRRHGVTVSGAVSIPTYSPSQPTSSAVAPPVLAGYRAQDPARSGAADAGGSRGASI